MTPDILFPLPPQDLCLAEDELHVFAAPLDQPPARLERLTALLSQDELARAARFHFETDRKRFLAGRGFLREILGWILRIESSKLEFSYSASGKPSLANLKAETKRRNAKEIRNTKSAAKAGKALLGKHSAGAGLLRVSELGLPLAALSRRRNGSDFGIRPSDFSFNLAHSDSLALYAVARRHDVGVDIERVRPIPEAEQIAEHFFSQRENARWRSLPAEQRTEAFFNCWTRKEACLKATGEGIGQALHQVEVGFDPGQPAQLLSPADGPDGAAHWSLHSLTPAPGYVGAAAARRPNARVVCWKWGVPADSTASGELSL